jgi:ribose transport system substrate-binding protein
MVTQHKERGIDVRKAFVVLSGLILALALGAGASVARNSGPAGATGAKATYNVVLITNNSFDPFYITLAAGAKAEAKRLGVNLSWQAPKTLDLPAQTQVLQAAVAKKPDFIVMSTIDARGLIAPLKKVKEAGIPVLTVDTDVLDPSVRLGTITSDNELGGKIAAQTMARLVGGKGKVAYQGYIPGIQSVDLRRKGWDNGLKAYKGIENVGPSYDNYDLKQIVAKTNALMQRHSDLAGIFAPATNEVIGVANAVQNAGKAGKVKVVGFDGAPDEVTALRRGSVTALVVQKAYTMGVLGVRYANRYLANGTKPPARTKVEFVVVTKNNVNLPEVKKYLYRAK